MTAKYRKVWLTQAGHMLDEAPPERYAYADPETPHYLVPCSEIDAKLPTTELAGRLRDESNDELYPAPSPAAEGVMSGEILWTKFRELRGATTAMDWNDVMEVHQDAWNALSDHIWPQAKGPA